MSVKNQGTFNQSLSRVPFLLFPPFSTLDFPQFFFNSKLLLSKRSLNTCKYSYANLIYSRAATILLCNKPDI